MPRLNLGTELFDWLAGHLAWCHAVSGFFAFLVGNRVKISFRKVGFLMTQITCKAVGRLSSMVVACHFLCVLWLSSPFMKVFSNSGLKWTRTLWQPSGRIEIIHVQMPAFQPIKCRHASLNALDEAITCQTVWSNISQQESNPRPNKCAETSRHPPHIADC